MDPKIGAVIVDEVAKWSNSTLGTTHMIVTGDTVLRKLAFDQTTGVDLTSYPSFNGTDLNYTKLQPEWIVPLRKSDDVRNFYEQFPIPLYTDSQYFQNFLYSGGRPSLMREKLDHPRFCVQADSHVILKQLSFCLNSLPDFNLTDDWSMLDKHLKEAPLETVYHSLKNKIAMDVFELQCYDLADNGSLICVDGLCPTLGFPSSILCTTDSFHQRL
jgi:hypothetical protein